jgi:ankyrin repeat protein
MHKHNSIPSLRPRSISFRGCLVDPYSDRLLSLLHENNWDLAMKLIRRGEGLRWTSFGWTVLHFALWKLAPERLVIALLRGGLSANEPDIEDGKSSLHYAIQFHPNAVAALLSYSADTNLEDVGINNISLTNKQLTLSKEPRCNTGHFGRRKGESRDIKTTC